MLGEVGAHIDEASDGQEALDAYRADPYDIVFMDLTMPVMDGYTALTRIIEHDPDARVLVVSADVQPIARERCREAGAAAFLSKPVTPEAVEEALRVFLLRT